MTDFDEVVTNKKCVYFRGDFLPMKKQKISDP